MNISKDELLFADAFLKEHFERYKEWVVGDIKKSCRLKEDGTCEDNGALVGAFILWCCAIEYFGGLLTADSGRSGTKARIIRFTEKYLAKYGKYDGIKLEELRWSLIHYYSPHHFVLAHEGNLGKYHLKKSNAGCVLHLATSIKHLEHAVDDYTKDLWSNPQLRINAWRYWKKQEIIKPLDPAKIRYTDEECD